MTIASATWRQMDPEVVAKALTLDLPPLRVVELSFVVDEGDNAALPIQDASLLLPAY